MHHAGHERGLVLLNNFQKVATGVDVIPLLVAIKRQPELWQEDSFLRHYPQGPFGEVESIMLRFPEKVELETEEQLNLYKANMLPGFDQHESIDYPAYSVLPEARQLIMNLMAYVKGTRLGRCIINKVNPGGRIFPHADSPEHAGYWQRFHIVLESQPGNVFRAGDEQIHMQQGEIWWFENQVEHEVINNSAESRIHLVVDIRV
jgi:hypothetical protein